MFFKGYRKGSLVLTDCCAADVRHGSVRRHVDILIQDGKIAAVGGFDPKAVDAEKIAVRGRAVTPGLIDAHVHLCLSGMPNCHLKLDELDAQGNERLLRENLARNLANGITTVRDLGCRWDMLDAMDRLSVGDSVYPSVQTSGPVLTIPEGHGIFFGEVVFPENAPDVIRQLVSRGAEVIKLIGTGGNLSPKTDCHGTQYTDEQFGGIMDAVHAAGLGSACHVHAAAAIEQCIQFGVRSIEHGSYMEEEQVQRLSELSDRYWVPTVCPGRLITGLSEAAQDRVARRRRNIRLAVRSGCNLVAGTDAGIGGLPHGYLPYELDEFVDGGMTTLEALRSGTYLAARMMDKEGEIGILETGADADILVFEGDLEDRRFSFHAPSVVIKCGHIVSVADSPSDKEGV